MKLHISSINQYKQLALSFCEPDFEEYYRLTGLKKKDWLDNDRALRFLENHLLSPETLPPGWGSAKEKVFLNPISSDDYIYPTHIFNKGFIVSCKRAGGLFDNKGYIALRESLLRLGEKKLFIEKIQEQYEPFPLLFSFPTQYKWEYLISGGFFASYLFCLPHGFYFLFGESATWGLFVANDAIVDVEVLGIKEPYTHLFSSYYEYDTAYGH